MSLILPCPPSYPDTQFPTYTYLYFSSCNNNNSQQHTDNTKLSVTDWDRTYIALVSILLSQRIGPPCQPGFKQYEPITDYLKNR